MKDELYHYGVPGMRWGVRKYRNELAKATGRDKSSISDEEAQKFRGDVVTAKTIKNKGDRTAWVSSNAKNLGGEQYAAAVLQRANKESARSFATKTTVGVGVGAVAAIALWPVARLIGEINKGLWGWISGR